MWDRSIIVIHGDHGSRIAKNRTDVLNREILTAEDYRDTYSTFFVYKKAMSTKGDVDSTPASLRKLLASTFAIPATVADDQRVYLSRAGLEPHLGPALHELVGFSN
jgi:hypothetical protein